MNLILAAADPVTHAVPYPLHEKPILSVHVGSGDVPALNIYDGVYNFFITNHLMMSAVAAGAVLLTFMFVAGRVKASGGGAGVPAPGGRGRWGGQRQGAGGVGVGDCACSKAHCTEEPSGTRVRRIHRSCLVIVCWKDSWNCEK